MDVLTLSRIQFALNIGFHYLYPPISIGLGLLIVIMEGLYLKTKKIAYKEMTHFWIQIFALTFALGVATGLVQTFAFGTNWARYSRFVGDVFGSALAAEGVFAFFLEAGFLGVLLFGWNRVGPKLHYFASICVCLGAHFSAVWIVVANSWMQTPAGFRIVDTALGPRAEVTDFWQMVLNPSAMDRLIHVLLACYLTGAFFVLSVAAYYLLKKRHFAVAQSMMKVGLIVALMSLILQLISGDSSARLVAQYQPAKLAASEGIYETKPYTPITIIGWVDSQQQKVHGIQIPGGLSFLTTRNLQTPIAGLDQIPKENWPNVNFCFHTYHIMIFTWGILFLIATFGFFYWMKKRLAEKKWLLWAMVFSVILPHIGQQAGWMFSEVGRQPWLVYNVLRTSEGVSKNIHASQVLGSITMFVLIYLLLFALFLFLLDRKIKHGPDSLDVKEEDQIYSNLFQEGRF